MKGKNNGSGLGEIGESMPFSPRRGRGVVESKVPLLLLYLCGEKVGRKERGDKFRDWMEGGMEVCAEGRMKGREAHLFSLQS